MSLDLLKEFGGTEKSQLDSSLILGTKEDTVFEEDDFGEFEKPEDEEKTTNLDSVAGRQSAGQYVGKDPVPHRTMSLSESFENRGFVQHSILFDADDNSSRQPQIVLQTPLKPRENPRLESQRSIENSSDQYDFGTDEAWHPMEIQQDVTPPSRAGLSTVSNPLSTDAPKTRPGAITDFGPPPTNIPPPSILLPLTLSLFESASAAVRDIVVSKRATSQVYEILDQDAIERISGILALIRAGARIVAGRKLRWKRDSILSQSMRIGPSTGKSGGMKLTGLDKTESRREDQEITEAVRVWKKQVGPLRSAIGTVNLQLAERSLTVPEIAENIPIVLAKASEGAVSAPRCCFLCGVKRDERVSKVDVAVEDSFGEWWRDHWGHVDCVSFWNKYKGDLQQR